eukprot:11761777-Alexandrium_andersonii.AAC.1
MALGLLSFIRPRKNVDSHSGVLNFSPLLRLHEWGDACKDSSARVRVGFRPCCVFVSSSVVSPRPWRSCPGAACVERAGGARVQRRAGRDGGRPWRRERSRAPAVGKKKKDRSLIRRISWAIGDFRSTSSPSW